ncbi:hypothetical protein ACFL27_02720 [candidate division CSSED10-310 bacterium]|uniref:Glycosyltransferase RgtA/B/C/D-like domain-containing protein n=1 Tax=candidate division CSSED10-310 bacterium TaxID=2855610 RepID=A0ABV6YSD6_UNCC1
MKETPYRYHYLLVPSLAGILLLVFFLGAFHPVKSRDIFWHLKTGQYIYENGTIPARDPFSFTARGRPWHAHEWLSDVLLYLVHKKAGFLGLIVLKAILLGLTFMLLFRLSSRQNRELPAFLMTLLAGLVCLPYFIIRPQMFSYLFFVITFYWLECFPQKRIIWWFPLLIFCWSHLHGAFIFGQALFMLYYLEHLKRYARPGSSTEEEKVEVRYGLQTLTVIGFLALITPLLNHKFHQVYLYPFEYMGQTLHKKYIYEWFPVNFQEELPAEIFLICLLVSLIYSSREDFFKLSLLLIPFTHLGLTSARNIPFWVFVATPLIVSVLPGPALRREVVVADRKTTFGERLSRTYHNFQAMSKRGSILGSLLIIIIFVGIQGRNPPSPSKSAAETWLEGHLFPIQAVTYLKSKQDITPLFNEYEWGGYILWQTDLPVFIDGRADVYIPDILLQYMAVVRPRDSRWQAILHQWQIKTVIIKRHCTLSQLLAVSKEWALVYSDDVADIYEKSHQKEE